MDLEIGKLLFQAAISVGGAFLAASLAMNKYRNEKWWEMKASAYAELVEALHKMKWPVSEHLDAEMESREMPDEVSKHMWEEFRLARHNAWRVADTASFLISEEAMKEVQEMERGLGDSRNAGSWFEHLDVQYAAIEKCLLRIKEIGKSDLKLKSA